VVEMLLEVNDLHCGYGKREIVHGATFGVGAGEFVCIIGANGCGKSTLLNNILQLDKPFSGQVLMGGDDVSRMSDAVRAKRFAYLPQEHTPPFPFSVADVVLMGRTAHMNAFAHVSDEDRDAAWDALCLLGVQDLAECAYTELSGGQRQLVLIARCLAQKPELIIMDEPTASLDFGNQQIVLSRMHALTREGLAVLMVTHDPHHAFLCADRVVVVQNGVVSAQGAPKEVMTPELLESVYDTGVDVVHVTLSNGLETTLCAPLWGAR
jgi:iron complex transport system ATP-binding protein